ncbi:phage minor head protein [Pseudomonas citronellolis]|uniref:phage head morphogenesis protein n=1 Tax=Pseudomonas citronellolis TaxID=53408 RepID=UPI0023E36370|nr:phage minor head protein [Pseudomonas citronellolis]MDF3931387.1 phage minor head protein [Pseudomonas citronellolis]
MTPEQSQVPVPKDALDWFRAKGMKPSFDHRDVWQEEHATTWTVAKAMRLDILEAIRSAVDEMVEAGQDFGTFKRELQPLLVKLGWWGVSNIVDPLTGEKRDVQLGSPRRLRTIYDINLRTANAAGQWQRIERTKKTHPYLLYQLGPSQHHREQHLGWAGILLPADDPFWQTHFPPNGWGCKCWVRQVSRREAERLLATGDYLDRAPTSEEMEYINRRTGQVLKVPAGIDPGWAYNPGAVSRPEQAQQQLAEKEKASVILAESEKPEKSRRRDDSESG